MFRGLLGVHLRYGLPVRRAAQGGPLHRRLRRIRYLPRRSDCYRLERTFAGWDLHPLKTRAFTWRTKGTFSIAFGTEVVGASHANECRCSEAVAVDVRQLERVGTGQAHQHLRSIQRLVSQDRRRPSCGQSHVFCGASSCAFNLARCAISSSALARPAKYQQIISYVRKVGLRPVHRLISRQAMMAQ